MDSIISRFTCTIPLSGLRWSRHKYKWRSTKETGSSVRSSMISKSFWRKTLSKSTKKRAISWTFSKRSTWTPNSGWERIANTRWFSAIKRKSKRMKIVSSSCMCCSERSRIPKNQRKKKTAKVKIIMNSNRSSSRSRNKKSLISSLHLSKRI